MTVVTGKAYWAHVQAPNTAYEPEWSIDLIVDDNNRSAIEADGLTIKNKGDERGDFVHIRQRVKRRDGSTNATEQLIGNGSTVNVLYAPFDWEMNGKSGTSAILKKVQVVDLVSYGEDLEVVDGFVDGQSSTTIHEDEVPF